MSFGSSTKFQAGTENGKPVIFWEQQALAKEKKKKFSYKDKGNKYPLRQTKQKSLEEASPTHKPPTGSKPPAAGTGNKAAANRSPGHKAAAVGKDWDGSPKKGKTTPGGKKGSPAHDPTAVNPGTVTLTQEQLTTILDTIGRLTISNQELSESQKVVAIGGVRGVDETPKDITAPPQQDASSPEAPAQHAASSRRTFGNQESPLRQSTQERGFGMPSMENSRTTPGFANDAIPPRPPLTKAEIKRLQWERERAEEAQAYNPWGKPGAGAPIKDRTGNIVTDYKTRKDDDNTENNSSKQDHLTRQSVDIVDFNRSHNQGGGMRSMSSQPGQSAPTADRFKDSPSVEPAAIRSSFTVGAIAPDSDKFNSVKDQQKKQWLAELEQQRVEQQLRKEEERRKWKGADSQATWADKMGGYEPQGLPEQGTAPTATVDDMAALQGNKNSEGTGTRTFSAPTTKPDPLTESQTATHIRGQNVLIDPETQKEMEEKRRRHMEHQDYIKQQVEDKQRIKREERERKIREEQEEEKKLQAERDRIQKLYELEQEKLKAKEENKRKRLDDLKKAMDDAKEQAEREKHEKRLRKLEEGGHQTSRYHENFEAHRTPRSHNEPPSVQSEAQRPQHQEAATQRDPPPVPALNLGTSQGGNLLSTTKQEMYTENRLLTPSQYRENSGEYDPSSPRREFGTQTGNVAKEIRKALGHEESSDTTDIEYREPRKGHKRVRLKSAPKEDKKRGKEETTDEESKPKWGQGGTAKVSKAVKNSDKDPSYQRNKKQKELRRKERQQQLLAEADKFAKYVPGDPGAASSRARSRSPPGSRGNVKSRSSSQGRSTGDSRATLRSKSVRSIPPSPPIPALRKAHDPAPEMESEIGLSGSENQGHVSQRSHVDHLDKSQNKTSSPPVPALKHRPTHVDNDYDVDTYNYDQLDDKDVRSSDVNTEHRNGAPGGERFVPFVRSMNVLDPAHAESPMPLSRENTAIERGRRAYMQNTHPANYGVQLDNLSDQNMQQEQQPITSRQSPRSKDPILNPDMVKKVPTERQGQILQQLTELRKGLLMKQRELEIMAPLHTVEVE